MATPLRELVAEIRLKLNSQDIKKIIKDTKKIGKVVSNNLSKEKISLNFDLDSAKIKDVIGSAKAIGREFDKISNKKPFERVNKGSKNLLGNFGLLRFSVASLAVGLASIAAKRITSAFGGFITDTAKSSRALDSLSISTGISREFLEAFSFAAEGIGVSSDQAKNSLATFTTKIAEARRGSKDAAEAFGLLGVDIFDANGEAFSATEMLSRVSTALSNVSNEQERARLATKIFGGGAASLLPVLSGAEGTVEDWNRSLDALGGRLSSISKKESNDFLRSMRDLDYVLLGLKDSVLKEILPPLNDFVKTLKDLFIANKDIINSRISAFFEDFVTFLKENPDEKIKNVAESIEDIAGAISLLSEAISTLKSVYEFFRPAIDFLVLDRVSDIIKSSSELEKLSPVIKSQFKEATKDLSFDSVINFIKEDLKFFGRTPDFYKNKDSMQPSSSSNSLSINSPANINMNITAQPGEDGTLLAERIRGIIDEAITQSNRNAIESLGFRYG